ncbi:MAG: DEAD/DEAH box helicase [Chthoniobacterales bacterium]
MSISLALTPHGHLRLQVTEEEDSSVLTPAVVQDLKAAFDDSSEAGLLALATRFLTTSLPAQMRWWREFACECITAQCHNLSSSSLEEAVPPPPASELALRTMTAPPMVGLEYLEAGCLEALWKRLAERLVSLMSHAPGGGEAWLREQNPSWKSLGRVTFHLAENKRNQDRPFAFLATYTHRLARDATPQYLPLGKALVEYGAVEHRETLLKLLSPIHAAAERSDFIRELLDSKKIFHPQAWSPTQAYSFLKDLPIFEEAGLIVRSPNWWKSRQASRPKVNVTIGKNKASAAGLGSMLDFDVSLSLGGEILSAAEVKQIKEAKSGLMLLKGQWVEVNHERLEEALAQWKQAEAAAKGNGVSFIEAMRLLAGMSPNTALGGKIDDDFVSEWSHVEAGERLREQLEKLGNPAQATDFDPGEFLKATLRPYQEEGIRWLWVLHSLGLGACLADDMGLGKTLQVIGFLTHLKKEKPNGSPSLLIAPASLLANWQNEIARFAPHLRVSFAHASFTSQEDLSKAASDPVAAFTGVDLVATTYGMVARQEWLRNGNWQLLILDEAQAIKNPSTRQTLSVKELPTTQRIALTGTPVENHLGDLWSLFDFINPGLLGNATHFSRYTKGLDPAKPDAYGPLRRLIKPYILRRLKTDKSIIADLPDKTEIDAWCLLSQRQAALYQQSVNDLAKALEEVKKNRDQHQDIQRRGLVLAFLMRFKQICNHPSQLLSDKEWKPEDSGKFLRLASLCEEIASRQEKVLIFTQFREMTKPLSEYLEKVFGRTGLLLDGSTAVAKRQEMVTDFQRESGPPFFILSLKAGGTGLNLTEAAHVIHFDRWWNPAVENQATDRAFRIGQKRNVLVHKFICRGTVEERIAAMINDKKGLADSLLGSGAEKMLTEMNNDELLKFVALDLTSMPGAAAAVSSQISRKI